MLVSTIEDCLLVKPFEVLLLGLTHPTFLLQFHTLNNCPLVIINNEPVRNHYNTMFSFKFLILPCIIINQLLTGTLCMLFRPRHFACQSCFVYRSYPHHLLKRNMNIVLPLSYYNYLHRLFHIDKKQ